MENILIKKEEYWKNMYIVIIFFLYTLSFILSIKNFDVGAKI